MIASVPPMGWNSWDCWGAAATEETVRENARVMAEKLKKYGWTYIVVDIEWYQPTARTHEYVPFAPLCTDEYGRLIPAVEKFPSAADGKGFGPLADYIHSLGLKFGIHIMRGLPRQAAAAHLPIWGGGQCDRAADPNSICAWNPDMYGLKCDTPDAKAYYESIFRLYAGWGVDYVKCDDIAREYPRCRREIELISEACRGCGRDMVLSLSPGPAPLEMAEHLKTWANMWRITDDFWDEWRLLKGMFDRAREWCVHAGPGHWPDADMLPVGALRQDYDPEDRTRFTEAEQRTMLSLWCMMRSPLMIGGDLRKLDGFTEALLTNGALLNIEKKSWCAHPLTTTDVQSVWVAPKKASGGWYAALFNLSDEALEMTAPFTDEAAVELWSGKRAGGPVFTVAPHDALVFDVTV